MTQLSARTDNSTDALAHLRRRIGAQALSEGARLPTERQLAEEMGVGRRAVRRALEVLEAEGLIWRRQGKGTFAGAPPDDAPSIAAALVARTNPEEVMEARLSIEPQLARLAAFRATQDDVGHLRALAARIAGSGDADARELWDGALHRLIARIARNRLLLGVFDILDEVRRDETWRQIRERARTPAALSLYRDQHGAIIEAIAAHDGAAAEARMRAHLLALAERLRESTAEGMDLAG
jgi:DNA-binding FadR family transcriptional regulator